MRLVQKGIALTVILSLLGQSALFAAATESPQVPLTEVQASAKQDHARLLEKGLLPLASSVAITEGLFIFKLILDKKEQKQQIELTQKEAAQKLSQQINETQRNKAKLAIAEQDNRDLTQENSYLLDKNKGLKKGYERQVNKANVAKAESMQLRQDVKLIEKMYSLKLQIALDELKIVEGYADHLFYFGPEIDKQLEQYVGLFDKELSKEERAVLRAQLEKAPWLNSFSTQTKKDFLEMIDNLMVHTQTGLSREGNMYVFSKVIQGFVEHNTANPAQYALVLSRKILTKSNLLALGTLLALSIPALNAQAQAKSPLAQRIEKNFDRFLNASAEELTELEQDPQAYEACMKGAALQHAFANLSDEDQQTVKELLTPVKQNTRPAHRNLAY